MGYDTKRFKGLLSPEFICSICGHVFDDPVLRPSCQHVFCKNCIASWLQQSSCCPVDRQPLIPSDLQEVPQIFQLLLHDLEISCDFASHGCQLYLRLDHLAAHAKECAFNPLIKCSKCGASLMRKDLGSHSCTSHVLSINKIVHENERLLDENQALRLHNNQLQLIITNQQAEIGSLREELRQGPDASGYTRSLGQQTRTAPAAVSSEHKDIVNKLKREGQIVSYKVFESILSVDFWNYYGYNGSDASCAAKHLEKWSHYVKEGCKVLDMVLSAYEAVCLALMVGPTGSVVALTDKPQGVDMVRRDHGFLLDSGRLKVVVETDAKKLRQGYPPLGPYDVILVDYSIGGQKIGKQLIPGGILFCGSGKKILQSLANGVLKQV